MAAPKTKLFPIEEEEEEEEEEQGNFALNKIPIWLLISCVQFCEVHL